MKVDQGLCQLLDWDSEFFGFRIARLRQSDLTPLILSDVFEWCDREEVRCLYFLVSAGLFEDNRIGRGKRVSNGGCTDYSGSRIEG